MNATRAIPLADAARDHLLLVEQGGNGQEPYPTTPRGCRCEGGPLRDAREPWFVTCVKCGAILNGGAR